MTELERRKKKGHLSMNPIKFGLVDETGEAGDNLHAIAAAVQIQIDRDVCAAWPWAPAQVACYAKLSEVPQDTIVVALLKDSDQAGALGYHAVTPDGRAYAKIFTGPTLENGGTWTSGPNAVSVTVSHELLETLGDLFAADWTDSRDGTYERAKELCDMVESQSYDINGVSVSNFLLPAYFDPSASSGPYDFLGLLPSNDGDPGPGNYEIRRSDGDAQPVYGEHYPEWKKALKAHPASRLARRSVQTDHDDGPPTEAAPPSSPKAA